MKISRIDAHDRLKHFISNQSMDIGQCCQNLIDQRPFGDHAFYIFAHKRTLQIDERFKLFSSGYYKNFEDVPSMTIIWQPRLSKPKAQTNSMLFKAYPGSDALKVIWIIPECELWDTYTKGKLTENSTISESIYNFLHDRKSLERPEEDDLSEERCKKIYDDLAKDARKLKRKKEKEAMLKSSEALLNPS